MITLGLSAAEQALYERSLYTGYNLKITLQVLDLNHNYIADISDRLIDGQVNNSYFDVITSSATLTLLDPDRIVGFDTSSPSDGALFADRMIRIVYSVWSDLLPKWVDVPIFCGPVTKVNRDDALLSVECQDKTALSWTPMVAWKSKNYTKGSKLTTVTKDVFTTFGGEKKFDLPEYGYKLGKDYPLTPEKSLWTFIGPIVGSRNIRQMWYDGRGVLRLRPKPTKPVWQFTDYQLLSVPKLDYNNTEIRNAVTVKGATPTGKAQLKASRFFPSSHSWSAKNLGRAGLSRHLMEIVEDTALNTQTEVNNAADDLLESFKMLGVNIEFDSFVIPHLEPGDVYNLSTPDISVTGFQDKFAIPLVAGQPMSNGVIKKISTNRARLRR